ncbi:MAG: DUF3604 domain-containing protein [Myxococcota bacterium]
MAIRRATPLALAALLAGCGADPPDPALHRVVSRPGAVEQACADPEPLRRAFFGDLHVHTALSLDAWSYDLDLRPRDAYAYAFGRPVRLPPRDAAGRGTREVRIARPLDFAAVTDHAEFLGEQRLCTDPESPVHASETCTAIRESTTPLDNPVTFDIMDPWPRRAADVCGDDGSRCAVALDAGWQETIAAAEEWNDRSPACRRTTFIGYEWSSVRLGSNLHRNVIFRNHVVPRRPISYLDVQREWELWRLLRDVCLRSGSGCDVLAIPHNSNISNGRMFAVDYPGVHGLRAQRERAALRASLEPIVEVMQHKGDSECVPNAPDVLGATDEACAFEKFGAVRHQGADPGACWDVDWLPHLGPGACRSHRDFVRYVLTEGLREEARLGVNPFKLGLAASTDTHNALAGGVDERDWPGHLGVADADPQRRLSEAPRVMGNMANGPGGLFGVWAEENSRDALFDAMRRREVFGTSGPRIRPRFFGGWDLPADLCDGADGTARADAAGVPMGADLPPRAGARGAGAPSFLVQAAADAGTASAPGGDLQRIQVVKGWVDDAGRLHQRVFDAAGGPNDASVDPATCQPIGRGARQLCAVWRDPAFDPERRAVYYARVLENPSCRHSAWQCLALPEAQRPDGCAHRLMQAVQQERAWTSPIWYTPGA